MERRTFIGALAGGLVAVPLLVRAQQATKTHRIGLLRIDRPPQAYIDAFEQGLRDRVTRQARTFCSNTALPTASPRSFRGLLASWSV